MMINSRKVQIVKIDPVDDSLILTGTVTGSMNDRRSYRHREGWHIFNPNFVVDSCFNLVHGV